MSDLASFLRASRDAIVAEWLAQVERLPSATGQSRAILRDHIPQLIDEIARAIERGDANDGALDEVAGQHAALRYHAGYDLRQIVLEYQALRRTILAMYAETPTMSAAPVIRTTSMLDQSLDAAIGDAVDRFTDERDRARDVFVGILGHDLRNPLQSIAIGAAALLKRRDQLDPVAVQIAERTRRAALRMDRMINDVLDFARGRLGGGIPITPTRINLRPLVRNTVEELAHAHPDRAIECRATRAPGDFEGEWDGPRIAQVVSNLVGNAIEHGGDPIVVEPIDEGDAVRIAVRNAGTIPEEIRPTLFQPFHSRTSGKGLGLGLYVVDEIARAHGGRVDVDSDAEHGTRIGVVLPRRPGTPTRPRRP